MLIEEPKLTVLADKLIQEIKSNSDFFSGVTVIFPDKNVEKWFKSYWLKKEKDVLMNINTKIIRNALFDLFENKDGYTLISKDILRYIILKKLSTEEYKNESLPGKYKNYFYGNNSFNCVHLYDLSSELAAAFMEYEQGTAILVDDWELDFYKRLIKETKEKYKLVTLSNIDYVFKPIEETIYFFGFIDFTPTQKEIIDSYSKNHPTTIYKLSLEEKKNKDINFKVIKAPSKLREIETLHSNICELIKENGYNFSDFLVVCPNLSEYETIINRVFKQDDIDYPNIPFVINNSELSETEVTEVIKKLIEIHHKGFYTRKDLFELITNSIVMKSRNISEDNIDTWVNSILDTNTYRQRDNHDDWDYIKKRLLLSKVSNINDDNNIISLEEINYSPYSSIGFDDDSIIKFVSVIDDLNNWIKTINNIKILDKNAIFSVKNELNKWLSILNEDGIESNKLYKNVVQLFDLWDELEIYADSLPLSIFFYSVLDASKKSRSSGNEIISSGITFVNFNIEYILSSSNVFFLGASSSNIPSKKSTSELYLSRNKISDLERKAFLLQYQNSSKNFIASYVDIDLKTEEEFFPSMFISEIKSLHGNEDEKIPLDEKREWGKLFTRREFKEKLYFANLLDSNSTSKIDDEISEQNRLDRITSNNIEKYLTEPLSFQANRLFANSDEDRNEVLNEYEPFSLNNLQKYKITRELIYLGLDGNDISNPEFVNSIKENLKLNNEQCGLSEKMDEDELISIIANAQSVLNVINELRGNAKGLIKLPDLSLDNSETKWVVECSEEVYRVVDGETRTYVRLKSFSTKDNKNLLYAYVFSLMDVASQDNNITYKIILKSNIEEASFEITKEEAISILNKIHTGINDIKNTKCVPMAYSSSVSSAYDLYYKIINDGGAWAHFDHSKAFDENKLGYDDDNFDYHETDIAFKELIKYIKPKEEKSDE